MQSAKLLNENYIAHRLYIIVSRPRTSEKFGIYVTPTINRGAHEISGALARAGAEGAVEEAAAWSDT